MMKRHFRKLFFAGLFLSAVLVQPAAAQTIEALQAQLNSLLQQVAALQAQLAARADNSATAPLNNNASRADVIYYFVPTRDLYAGLSDRETGGAVTELQKFLKSHGAVVYPEGIVSGYFGVLTEKAVQRWQAVNGVVSSGTPATTGYGVVGPKTRAAIMAFVSRTQVFHSSQDQELTGSTAAADRDSVSAAEDPFRAALGNSDLTERLGPQAPIIYSITPRSGPPGTYVTIRGVNFSRSNNTVMVGYATLKNVSSPDGQTIRYFHNPPLYDTEDEFNGYTDKEQFVQETLVPLGLTWEQFIEDSKEEHWIYVFNENGESAGSTFYGEPRVRFINPHVMTN